MKQLTWELANQLIAENTEEISSEEINKNPLVSISIDRTSSFPKPDRTSSFPQPDRTTPFLKHRANLT